MNFKALLLTTLAAATVPTAAKAGYEAEGWHLMDKADFPAKVHTVVDALHANGVAIVNGDLQGIEECVKREVYGYYDYVNNYVMLCPSAGEVPETLVHEAVHTVQDCRGGLENDHLMVGANIQQMRGQLNARHKADIQGYDQGDQIFEVEARYYEQNMYADAVAAGLNKFCM